MDLTISALGGQLGVRFMVERHGLAAAFNGWKGQTGNGASGEPKVLRNWSPTI